MSSDPLDDLLGYPAVDGHEVNAVFSVFFYGVEYVVFGHVDNCSSLLDGFNGCLVYGNGSDWHFHSLQYGSSYLIEVAGCAEVHEGVGAVPNRNPCLFKLKVYVAHVEGSADVCIYFCAQPLSDPNWSNFLALDIAGDDHGSVGYPSADVFR